MNAPLLVDAYLTRLGLPQPTAPTLDYLIGLQKAHMLHVPFENLSVVRHEPVVLEEARLVAKIVERRRGGFCFELNGALAWLLRALGFHVTRVAAGVHSDKGYSPYFDHMALLVMLERPYLVDVGFGDGARLPVPLSGDVAAVVSGRHRVALQEDDGVYVLQQRSGAGWEPRYRFTCTPRELSEYAARCRYLCTSPDSVFMQGPVCTIATPSGRVSLSSDNLTITQDGEQTKRPIASEAEFDAVLARYFGAHFVV